MMDCSFSFADKMDLTSETIGNSAVAENQKGKTQTIYAITVYVIKFEKLL